MGNDQIRSEFLIRLNINNISTNKLDTITCKYVPTYLLEQPTYPKNIIYNEYNNIVIKKPNINKINKKRTCCIL